MRDLTTWQFALLKQFADRGDRGISISNLDMRVTKALLNRGFVSQQVVALAAQYAVSASIETSGTLSPTTPISITASELRKSPGQYLDRVFYRGERFGVARAGKPMAIIGPIIQR